MVSPMYGGGGIAEFEAIVDCLTAPGATRSTVCLTDDGTDQTLTGSLGDLIILPTSQLQLHSRLASAASAQFAFDLVDTIDRSSNATQNNDKLLRLRNSANSNNILEVSNTGEFYFGLSTEDTSLTNHYVLGFLQATATTINNISPTTGILAHILHANTTDSLTFLRGVVGSIIFNANTATKPSNDMWSGMTAHVASNAGDNSGYSAKVLAGLHSHFTTSASETALMGSDDDASIFVSGDFKHVTGIWINGSARIQPRGTFTLPTNMPSAVSGIRVPISEIGNTSGDTCAIYGDNVSTASSGTWSASLDRTYFMRIPHPRVSKFTNHAHLMFMGAATDTGGHAAPSGGETFDEVGGVYFDTGTNNLLGLYQHDGTQWRKLDDCWASSLTLGSGATTFAVADRVMTITGDSGGNTVATITGASAGFILTLIFVDANVTITDDNTHASDSTDLSAAFTSADDTTLQLVYDGTSWYEVSRSTN